MSEEDIDLFATALFTFRSIEQANCDAGCLKVNEIVSILDEVLNEKDLVSERDGVEIGATEFYRKVKKRNSIATDLETRNCWEAIRSIWLTFNNLNDHYIAWEQFVV